MPEKIRFDTDSEFEDLLYSYELPALTVDVDSVIDEGRRIRRRRRVAGLAATTAVAVLAAGAWAVLPGRLTASFDPASSATTATEGLRPGHQRIALEPKLVQDPKGGAQTERVVVDISYRDGALTVASEDGERTVRVDPQTFTDGGGQVFRLSNRSEVVVTERSIRSIHLFGGKQAAGERGSTDDDMLLADTGLRVFVIRGIGPLPTRTGITTYDGSRVMNQTIAADPSRPVRPPQAALDGTVVYYDRALGTAGLVGADATWTLDVGTGPLRGAVPLVTVGRATTRCAGLFASNGTPRQVSLAWRDRDGQTHETPAQVARLEPEGPWAWASTTEGPDESSQWTLSWTDADGKHTKTF